MRTASRLNSALCVAAISGLLDGEYCSQKNGTKPGQVHYAPDPALVASAPEESRFLPVEILAEAKTLLAAPARDNLIEIELAGGHRMRITGGYDPEALTRLIRGLLA